VLQYFFAACAFVGFSFVLAQFVLKWNSVRLPTGDRDRLPETEETSSLIGNNGQVRRAEFDDMY
jgi:hypothetical protein